MTYMRAIFREEGSPLFFFVVLSQEEILLVAIGSLLAILSFLSCRSAAVGASDIFLFLGLGLYLAVVLLLWASSGFEYHATHDNIINIIHILLSLNGVDVVFKKSFLLSVELQTPTTD